MDYRDIIRKNPGLIWYSRNYDGFEESTVVEAVLNYGDWDEFKALKESLSVERVAEIFRENAFRERTNYRDDVRQYFTLYFDKHAPRDTH
ncbi:MAG: hypothetical protein AAB420_01230 [Patescibacteria group bacterium]